MTHSEPIEITLSPPSTKNHFIYTETWFRSITPHCFTGLTDNSNADAYAIERRHNENFNNVSDYGSPDIFVEVMI